MRDTPTCVRCGRPTADGYACHGCGRELAQALTVAAGHAEDAWTVIARQARVGTAGSTRQPEPEPVTDEDLRRNPVNAFGWQASIERPTAGALRPEPTPADLGALDRLHAVENTMTTWARIVAEEHGGAIWVPMRSATAEAAAWLASRTTELRHHPAAKEAFKELHDACHQLERLVDRPADNRHLIGICDCGKVLYAPWNWTVIQCKDKTCGATWNLSDGQDILLRHLDGKLVTAAEAVHLAGYLDAERSADAIRKLIEKWAARHQLVPHGVVYREPTDAERRKDPEAYPVAVPTYRFGDIRDLLAQTPRRERKREGAAA